MPISHVHAVIKNLVRSNKEVLAETIYIKEMEISIGYQSSSNVFILRLFMISFFSSFSALVLHVVEYLTL